MKNVTRMKFKESDLKLKNLRALLNMSQLEMSEYLGIGRVLVALCEKKQRRLTGLSLKRFHLLTEHMREIELPKEEMLIAAIGNEQSEKKQQLIDACQLKYQKVKIKLDVKNEKLTKLQLAYYFLETLNPDITQSKAELKEFNLWRAYYLSVKDAEIKQFYLSEILELEAKVKANQAELAFLEGLK